MITVIELFVVITIIAFLVNSLGFSFQGWLDNYRIESQVKEMYVDLVNARLKAMQMHRTHFVVVTAHTYQIFEDSNGSGQFDAGDTTLAEFVNPKTFEFPVDPASWTGTVTMNIQGLVAPNNAIRFDVRSNNPDYDCLLLFPTRMLIGRWNGVCFAQ